jgi:hypothetical protein
MVQVPFHRVLQFNGRLGGWLVGWLTSFRWWTAGWGWTGDLFGYVQCTTLNQKVAYLAGAMQQMLEWDTSSYFE